FQASRELVPCSQESASAGAGLGRLVHAHTMRARFSGPGAVEPAEAKFDFWSSMADLGALVMRSGAPQLRLRIAAALVLVFVGKLCGVLAPVMLGDAINTLTPAQQGGVTLGASF